MIVLISAIAVSEQFCPLKVVFLIKPDLMKVDWSSITIDCQVIRETKSMQVPIRFSN